MERKSRRPRVGLLLVGDGDVGDVGMRSMTKFSKSARTLNSPSCRWSYLTYSWLLRWRGSGDDEQATVKSVSKQNTREAIAMLSGWNTRED